MATTAADGRRRWGGAARAAAAVALGAAAAAALVVSCAAPPEAGPPVTPSAAEPPVNVGLAVGAAGVTLGGDAALTLTAPDGARVGEIPAGEVWRAGAGGSSSSAGIDLATGSGVRVTSAEQVLVAPADGLSPVRANGRSYRGTLALLRDRTGITVVNRVPLESYLLGVVSAEMGRRDPTEREALRAQAVVSRTYAMRNLGRWRAQGFDLYATVADQVYAGIGAETPEGRDAVETTRGLVLTWNGGPIDAFFFSTCGGRTADGAEVFRGAERPYLRSVPDLGPDGLAYCAISPRYRWREEWSGEALRGVLRTTLPTVAGVAAARVDDVQDVRVVSRSASGRVARLGIALEREEVEVDGPSVRQVLRTVSGDILRSTAFTLDVSRDRGRVTRVVAEGTGNGHGVGFCQWGAVGRARSGQDFQRILAAYYPETQLSRLY